MKNDFDKIAPLYDLLANLAFGKTLERAQKTYLHKIEPASKLLIVGGGTGKIIQWIPEGLDLKIDYVELSGRMLDRARSRLSKGNEIDFVHGDAREQEGSYDVIIANFFLDCFSTSQLEQVLMHVKNQLNSAGSLLITDFYPSDRPRHKLLLKTMHWFFRVISQLDADGLINIHEQTKLAGFEPSDIQFFRKGSVFSAVYERST
ncbi:class I SAM-dependent methyltransferase [Roseivirga sp. E12]|uniref:class I SAM-dependent methyltransferase n=1 Tax=Roseivirga sp. E12 TaxID=2819237 RepID=UPI001ABC2268|nr:class I SAM-dependent methyltransferase [Roseivirga sp. E12]MBO3698906.1 class I SAM-dependent methyltransferase [Roseivirga sp. E12]